jgi:hypothetical protein
MRDLRLGLPDESVEQLVPKKKVGVMAVQVRSIHIYIFASSSDPFSKKN